MSVREILLFAAALPVLLVACSSTPSAPLTQSPQASAQQPTVERGKRADQLAANEIVLQAMGLLDIGYRFGGSNPEAGLDCSGMVRLVVEHATGRKLPHNAAMIAAQTRPIGKNELRPADLVFFNTTGATYSHMGIYIGNGRFIHAPSSRSRVRVDRIDTGYFAQRFSAARSLF
jgi:cell wall-associated NlpC family hydrolase